ncbi:MAG: nucleotidyltransferase domain-containing protein [Methanothrix sp.]|nr:nucleotidyltransferase domain-containing protein [Methanothrix sp.]
MAGEDIVSWVKTDLQFLQDPLWQERLLGVLLYGSQATGEAGPNSDIDLCIVAPVPLSIPARLG